MEHSQLSSAFFRVGLVADQTWWTEKDFTDDYKLASLGLWNEVIDSNERLSNWGSNPDKTTHKQTNSSSSKSFEKQSSTGNQVMRSKEKLLMPTCRMEVAQMQKALASMDPTVLAQLPQGVLTDSRCIFSSNWPIALLKAYPALTNTLKNNTTLSVFSHKHAIGSIYKDDNTLPYSINTIDELMYHKKIANPSIKNVWSNEHEKTVFSKAVWEPRLNANVPEFYPSVLLPPRQCPPRYSNVFGANYQSEVFPYNDDKGVETERETLKRKKNRRGTSEQRLTQQLQGVASSSSPNLLRSTQTSEKNASKTNDREIPRSDLNYWLQTVYPHRVLELSKFRTIARHIEAITHRTVPPFLQVVAPPPQVSASFTPSSERRLYRDVLARKIEDTVDKTKDDSEQNPFDELERQALEQYQSSETCLVNQSNGNDSNPDPEDSKFQDLEREALEQYTEDGDDQIERSPESPSGSAIDTYTSDSKADAFIQSSGSIDLNHLTLFKGAQNIHKHEKLDKIDLDEAVIAPESIVKSVVGYDKCNDEIYCLSQANEIHYSIETLDSSYELPKSLDVEPKNNKAKKNVKKKKKKQGDEENKYNSNKLQHHDKLRSANTASISYQLQNVLNVEEEIRRLANNLKHKVLNYLTSVDLKKIKELDENRRPNVKHQVSKDQIERPIQERIKVSDIDDLGTYKAYIREVSTKARSTLLQQFKRIRSEIMESTSRGIVSLVSPTTSEKRRVRQIIKKCWELRNHTDVMSKTPRISLNAAKREVIETLETVHNTMEVIYALSNLSKEAFKDIEFLKSGRTLVPDLYAGNITLEDKSEYIKQRVMADERSILLVVLFPRTPGILYDRGLEGLKKPNCRSIHYDHDLLRTDYAVLSKNFAKHGEIDEPTNNHPLLPTDVKVYTIFRFSRMESQAIWDPNNWSHITEIGKNRRRINIQFSSTGRQAEAFCRILTKLPTVRLVSRSKAVTAPAASPRKRRMSNTLASTTEKKTLKEQRLA